MFLSQIASDDLKKSFLELTHYVAGVDGHVNEKERDYLDEYMYEMAMDDFIPTGKLLAEIIQGVEDPAHKNIFFLEILALIFADGQYNDQEKQAVREIRDVFGFSEEKYETFKHWVSRMSKLHAEGVQLVNAG
jgi:tellurite resistance protein